MAQEFSINRPMFDILQKEYMDNSCEWLQYIPFYDLNLNDVNGVSDFRINMNDRENFFYPHMSFLEFSFKIVKTDGTSFALADDATLQNNVAGLMKRYEFLFDDKLVDYVDDPAISTTVRNLVYFSSDYQKNASMMMWYPDTCDSNVIDIQVNNTKVYAQGIEAVNKGMRKRWQMTKGSRTITVTLPLRHVFGLFQSYDKVVRGIKMALRLTRNDYNNILLRSGDPAPANDGKIVFSKNGIKWWIPKIKPESEVFNSMMTKLNSNINFSIPFVDLQIFKSNKYTEIQSNNSYQIRVKRKRPIKVFVCFQIDDPGNQNAFPVVAADTFGPYSNVARLTGGQNQVKRIFDNIRLTRMYVVLNANIQYPEQEYQTKFPTNAVDSTGDWSRVYSEFLRCGLRDHGIDEGTYVTYDKFMSLYPIFCFDLSEKPSNIKDSGKNADEKTLIEVNWSNEAIKNYYMWVIIESENSLEMATSDGQMKILKVTN